MFPGWSLLRTLVPLLLLSSDYLRWLMNPPVQKLEPALVLMTFLSMSAYKI